jgi:hypothetical protein
MTVEQKAEELWKKADKYVVTTGNNDCTIDAYIAGYSECEKENAELKKNYEDSLVACGVLKNKVELLAQPSPIESMQDTLITTQKIAYEKQKDQLTKAKEIIKTLLSSKTDFDERRFALWAWKEEVSKAEQFLKENE